MKIARFSLLIIAIFFFGSASASAQAVLTSLDGRRVDVTNQPNKVVVLAVGASWMNQLSAKQAEITNLLAKKYAGRPVAIYFVATDSSNPRSKNYASDAQIRDFASRNNLAVPVLRDSDGEVLTRELGLDQVPSFVILDKSGKPAGEPFGGLDPKYDLSIPIAKAIDKLL